jgi:hypothetical protein
MNNGHEHEQWPGHGHGNGHVYGHPKIRELDVSKKFNPISDLTSDLALFCLRTFLTDIVLSVYLCPYGGGEL